MKTFLWIVGIFFVVIACGFLVMMERYGSPLQDKQFYQQLTDKLTNVTQTQAEAMKVDAEADKELIELTRMLAEEQVHTARAEKWLVYVGIVALTAGTIVSIFLAWLAWKTRYRSAGEA